MPKISASPRLRLPQLEVLRALASGAKLTSTALMKKLDVSTDLVEMWTQQLIVKETIWVDESQEIVWSITAKGKRALEQSGIESDAPKAERSSNPRLGTLVPWAGGARMTAEAVGRELEGIPFVAVPFAGGMPELLYIKASTILVNDLHKYVINLARVAADPKLGPQLYRRLRRQVFHPHTLEKAQGYLAKSEGRMPALEIAEAYFISQWMGRNGKSGGPNELNGGLALRWSATGGDSALRYSNAVKGLREWRKILERCTFSCMDWRKVIAKVKDDPKTAIYADPPWPELSDKMYSHGFSKQDHIDLADALTAYKHSRTVVRYLECDLSKKLYPESNGWKWRRFAGRNTNNNEVAEVLIVKN